MDGREQALTETFVALTDTLVSDYDPLEFMGMLAERAVVLLDVSAAGVILLDARGGSSVAAASSERSRLLEVFAVSIDDGPCIDCARTGVAVSSSDIARDAARWPRFAAGALEAGFRSSHALPMRLRRDVVGVLSLLHTDVHELTEPDRGLGQALADAATIGLLQERAIRRAETVNEQLQLALNSRVIIEQAKGVVATTAATTPDEAFTILRAHARRHGLKLTALARDVVDGHVPATDLGSHRP